MEYKVCSEKKYVLYQHIPKVLTPDLLGVGVGVGVGVTPTPAKALDLKSPIVYCYLQISFFTPYFQLR